MFEILGVLGLLCAGLTIVLDASVVVVVVVVVVETFFAFA